MCKESHSIPLSKHNWSNRERKSQYATCTVAHLLKPYGAARAMIRIRFLSMNILGYAGGLRDVPHAVRLNAQQPRPPTNGNVSLEKKENHNLIQQKDFHGGEPSNTDC